MPDFRRLIPLVTIASVVGCSDDQVALPAADATDGSDRSRDAGADSLSPQDATDDDAGQRIVELVPTVRAYCANVVDCRNRAEGTNETAADCIESLEYFANYGAQCAAELETHISCLTDYGGCEEEYNTYAGTYFVFESEYCSTLLYTFAAGCDDE